MTIEIQSLDGLVHHILSTKKRVIAIDGYHGSGKTKLSTILSERLRIRCIHLDDFVVPNQGSFVQSLQTESLFDSLQADSVLIEGVCLLAVTDRLEIKPDLLVYVKASEPDPKSALGQGQLAEEVRAYHRQFRPSQVADIVYTGSTPDQEGQLAMNATRADRADIDIAFIKAKTKLAITLAAGGMFTLTVGLAVLMYGVTGQDNALIKIGGVEMSASGIGGVIMITSAVWAFIAYKARPIYSQTIQSSEKYDSEAQLIERHEFIASTQRLVMHRPPPPKRRDDVS